LSASQSYWNLSGAERWNGGIYRSVERRGDSLQLSGDAFEGTAFLPPLDSGEPDFRWGRVKLKLHLPKDASVQIYARASDEPEWDAWRGSAAMPGGGESARTLFGEPSALCGDVWLSVRGRWLWLAVVLTCGGAEKPRLDAVSILAESDHMSDFLPAVYQKDVFTYRFLSIFTAMFQDLEEKIELARRQLDPAAADPEMLRYLAHWLCADESLPEPELRRTLPEVIDEYESMYTVNGIRRSVQRLTGQTPWIIEHFSVDPNDPACSDPTLYRRLYGDDPYRFFLLLPQGTFSDQRQMERFLEQLQELVPAETTPELVLLKPCVQLDWHTYLGLNTRIGEYISAVIDETATIHYDMTIGGEDHER
jgi:phage tail-like protein